MPKEDLLQALRAAVLETDVERAVEVAQEIVESDVSINEAISVATKAIREIGDRFGRGEIFLPELIIAAGTMKGCMAVLTPHLEAKETKAAAKIVLATMKGDIHEIGKNLVGIMLRVSGFEVIDLGVDVPPMEILDEAEETGAQIIGLSSLMTTSLPYQKETISLLEDMGLRNRFFVIVGGGPVTRQHAQDMGADGWAKNAAGAVRICERLLSLRSGPPAAEFVFEEG